MNIHYHRTYIKKKLQHFFWQESSRSRKLSDWNQELDAKSDGTGRGHCNPPRSSLLHHIECSTDRIIIFRCYGYSWIIVFWLRLRRPYSRQRGYDLVLAWLIISWCWCGSNYRPSKNENKEHGFITPKYVSQPDPCVVLSTLLTPFPKPYHSLLC